MKKCYEYGAKLHGDAKSRTRSRGMSTLVIVFIVILVVGAVMVVLFSRYWPFVPTPGGITGSGNLVTDEMDFSDFTIVEVGYAFEVEITQSNSYSVTITADDNLFDYIQVSKIGTH